MSQRSDRVVAAGILLVTLAAYIATSPGRIDIVDGQSRYDVAVNWLVEGRPVLWDPIISRFMGVPGRDSFPYGYYGAAGSLFAMPLVAIGLLLDGPGETTRFLFSLTSPIFGALTAMLLYRFYRELGVHARLAALWTIAAAFTTLFWPGSISTFDNAQHAFFILAAVYLGHVSVKQQSRRLATMAGLVAGILLLYQEYFAFVIPALAAATLEWPAHDPAPSTRGVRLPSRESQIRFLTFGAASLVGLLLSFGYNNLRFESWLETGKLYFAAEGTVVGNPIAGLLTLLVSPGKSVFLYSPPLLLGLLGIRELWRQRPTLGAVVAATTAVVLLLFSSFKFAGGDWCWGPRYLVVVLPLWALAFPFMSIRTRGRRALVGIVLALGLMVQLLALSVEHQRFFFARGLQPMFWAEDSWVYFKRSALFARPAESLSLVEGVPSSARWFNSVHADGWTTYAILGPPPGTPVERVPEWMRQHQIYYLPRPWPLWMSWIEPRHRPINLPVWMAGVALVGVSGGILMRKGLRR